MPDVLRLGPLQLQGQLLTLLLACIVGYWLTRRLVRKLKSDRGVAYPIDDVVFNGGVIILLFWKFGVILTQPSLLWKQPGKLLLVSGSSAELLTGLLVALIYALFQLRKHQIPIFLLLDVLACGLTGAVLLYASLVQEYGSPTSLPWGIGAQGTTGRFHPYYQYFALLLVPLWIWQLKRSSVHAPGSGKLLKYTSLYVGGAGMLASFFAQSVPTPIYLSWAQLLFLTMLIIGMLLPRLAHNTNRRELSYMSQNDSKEQIKQDQQNKERQKSSPASGKEGFVDKKLDGPNRPST
ncbi:hypothetical protein ACFQZT_22475 [Paenibacillus sp. GCM10027628]|uniref:hypothetical protein n=1 Tax=Paenibacillus sp. GCM10027628 TaxID=3273413 RepID=UPI0036429E67